jgi:hypothetical protein
MSTEDPRTDRYTVPDPATATPPPPQAPPPPQQPPAPIDTALPPPPARTWRPPQADQGRSASLIFGVIILAVGLWFFASKTLGLDLPDIEWSQLWPLLLIGLGAWIVLGAMRRNR